MSAIIIATNRYYILCFHLLLSSLVAIFYFNYKKLSTFNYNLSSRVLLLVVFTTIGVITYDQLCSDLPPILNAVTLWRHILSQFELCHSCTLPSSTHEYAMDINDRLTNQSLYCCTKDLDKFIRFLTLIWSIILFLLLIAKSGRNNKLTLSRSCEYAARKYNWDYCKLVELCLEFKYNYFPIGALEDFISKLKNPVEKDDIDDFIKYFRKDENEHVKNQTLFLEKNIDAKTKYDEKINENKISYEHNMRHNVIERRSKDTWLYEQYLEQKSLVTFHTHLPTLINTNNSIVIENDDIKDGDDDDDNAD